MSRIGSRDRGRGRAVLAGTATAGDPAVLAPANSRNPLTVAELNTITASPGTAWAGTQHIKLFNGNGYKWSGTAWVSYP